MDTTPRLQVANRIQVSLVRFLGVAIDVGKMLTRPAYAREVLYVCDGSEDPELGELARQFRAAKPPPLPVLTEAVPGPQDAVWARNTSGFGAERTTPWPDSRPPVETQAAPGRGWSRAARWLRRTLQR